MFANLADITGTDHTLEEYFAIEGVGHARYEYWDGKIVCMSGGTRQSAAICGNAYFILRQQLEGRNYEAFMSGHAIKTPALPPYRYANGSVACGKAVFERIENVDALVNPTLIIEVLSPTTESLDRGPKRAAYQALPSLMEYVLVAQDIPHITHYLRHGDDWIRSDFGSLDVRLFLSSIDGTLSLKELYEGVEFP
jgi:Uma2 family endonuclease